MYFTSFIRWRIKYWKISETEEPKVNSNPNPELRPSGIHHHVPVVAGTVDGVTVRDLPWQRTEFVRHEEVSFTERNGGIGIDGLGFKASVAKRSQSQKILLTKSASEQPRTSVESRSPPKFVSRESHGIT